MMKNFLIKITAKQLKEFLEWEREHRMKLFPWMEEEDEDAKQAVGDVSTRGPAVSGRRRDNRADWDF